MHDRAGLGWAGRLLSEIPYVEPFYCPKLRNIKVKMLEASCDVFPGMVWHDGRERTPG